MHSPFLKLKRTKSSNGSWPNQPKAEGMIIGDVSQTCAITKGEKVLRIIDFVGNFVPREDEQTISDPRNTQRIVSYVPKKPKLQQVTYSNNQWVVSNTRQALLCYMALAQLCFKRCASAVPNSIHKLQIHFKRWPNQFLCLTHVHHNWLPQGIIITKRAAFWKNLLIPSDTIEDKDISFLDNETQTTISTNSNRSSPFEFRSLADSQLDEEVEDSVDLVNKDHPQEAGKLKSRKGRSRRRARTRTGKNAIWMICQ